MRGSCQCGGVQFEVDPPLRGVVACHCSQCRKQSGHYWAASSVPHDRFRLIRQEGLRWHAASASAKRGFCTGCGAILFWQPEGEARISFSPAALDGPSGLTTIAHIHTQDGGDYYAPEGPPPAPAVATELSGSCLCGANHFTLPGPMGAVWACHCTQCRKTSGHHAASFFPADPAAVVWQARHTHEYHGPRGTRRGFCAGCGSSLYFIDADGGLTLEAGAIDTPTGGQLTRHIFVAEKGDYYQIDDGLPQFTGWE